MGIWEHAKAQGQEGAWSIRPGGQGREGKEVGMEVQGQEGPGQEYLRPVQGFSFYVS